ncbi:uncharacterized protein EV420DRAFT_539018 [Desarmillaria tabescens]|uniref:Uncharacterized protein n=1 Tax=Armillaria tabescens TaxID=1929756 RepID=A0AA39KBT2_ARMTA|nr:uncharacterized protein EV420DRAFT_539018 [Desarmillaria tabescens]KAK0457080.1 hypothetical protein EV420DRAFT_539018 [Desarmillaria tabescens]
MGAYFVFLLLTDDDMAGHFHPQQNLYDDVIHDTCFEPGGTLRSIPSNAIVVRDQVSFYQDHYEASGTGRTMFQLLRNNHEVIIWGPPLKEREGLLKELELIESLLNSIDFDDIRQATLYIAWDAHARLIPQEQRLLQIPYLAGYPCIEESQLQVTEWFQVGWKRALLNGVRPVEVEYAYNLTSSLALQCMIDACRDLEPLDLTTPVLACLARDGRMIGVVKCVEDGARMVSYEDRTLIYSAFRKMQKRHIYLLEGHDMDPSAVLIVDDKVRFVDMALKRWFSPNVFIYDRTIHDKQQLKQAQRSHWRQAELLFERINARPATSIRYRPCEYRLINVISAPEMPLIAFSASPSVVSKRREKRRKRSSEPSLDAAYDEEYLPGRDKTIWTRRCKIVLNQCNPFLRYYPCPRMIINSESALSPRSLYPVPSMPHDTSSPRMPHGSIPEHRSGPSFCEEENIIESSWLEEFEF